MNLKSFAITVGAVVLAMFLFNMFTEQKITDSTGTQIGASQTSARKRR